MGLLNSLLGAIGYGQQPQAQAQPQAPQAPGVSDEFARQHGFPSAAAMQGFYANRQANLTGSSGNGGAPASSGSLIDQAMAIHPAWLYQSILNKLNQAIP